MQAKLLILWLLSEGPMHGYRIKRILDEDSLRFWFPVEVGSIYAVLMTLTKQGFLMQEAVEREGKRPERTVYKITQEGKQHYEELLRQAWSELPRMSDPVNAALAAMPDLPEEDLYSLLEQRAGALRDRLNTLYRLASSAPAPEMVDRMRALTYADLEWTESMLASREEKNDG